MQLAAFQLSIRLEATMLHSHLTTLNAVSLVLNAFKAEGLSSDALLAGSGISAADLNLSLIHISEPTRPY